MSERYETYIFTEEWRLLGCYAVWLLYEQTFRRKFSTCIIRVTRIDESVANYG
jgi:hypothetical protein